MDFKKATDRLLAAGCRLDEIAEELGVSAGPFLPGAARPRASGFRSPPEGWQAAAARVARRRGGQLCGLAAELEGGQT